MMPITISLQDIAMATWHPPFGLQTLQAIVTSKAVHLVIKNIHPRILHIDTKNDGFVLRKCISISNMAIYFGYPLLVFGGILDLQFSDNVRVYKQ